MAGVGRARGVPIRGRGMNDITPSEPLRRPGELRQQNAIAPSVQASFDAKADLEPPDIDDILKELCVELVDDSKLSRVAGSLKYACSTPERAKDAVEKVYKYSLMNKINAHYGAVLCKYMGDFQVEDVKFKFSFFKRLQMDYEDRNRKYANLDEFLRIVVVLCEIYHHIRLTNGSCFDAFVEPIIEYFGMLVDGGSDKEIETFVEQVTKCGKNLQSQRPQAFEDLLLKIRKQIIGISSVSSRNMLLHIFEIILNEWNPLSTSATNFYNAVCKKIVPACE